MQGCYKEFGKVFYDSDYASSLVETSDAKSHISLTFLNENNDAQYVFYKDHASVSLDGKLPEFCNDGAKMSAVKLETISAMIWLQPLWQKRELKKGL
ncbi:MAG: hypothetical protein K6G25_14190 [Bacteroidales bacterium]|nr:hypothetical protein [Bacteroidales bacterium]